MEAFHKNIDALENRIKVFIQKWKEIRKENELLIERNRQLEEEIAKLKQGLPTDSISEKASRNSDNNHEYAFIVKALDGYIEQVDHCINKLNKELDG
jgi:regulator of replication initiation timing